MNPKTAKQIRRAAGYVPGAPVEYEKPELHHLAHMPKFQTHTRIIREMGLPIPGQLPNWPCSGPRRRVESREVTKIQYKLNGTEPVAPIWAEQKDPETGKSYFRPQTEFIPITKPVRLLKGSPKALYRIMKRIEKAVGLDRLYEHMAEDMKP